MLLQGQDMAATSSSVGLLGTASGTAAGEPEDGEAPTVSQQPGRTEAAEPSAPTARPGTPAPQGSPDATGSAGDAVGFTAGQQERFWRAVKGLDTAVQQAVKMENVMRMVLDRRLNGLRKDFEDLQEQLAISEKNISSIRLQSKIVLSQAQNERTLAENASNAIKEAKSSEAKLLRREASLKDRILNTVQETQKMID
mmetsp:Transcript_35503/g.101389  ORF Transcript_35503/g.101389 Transcript_35503/m.101389 type:complete len:197 (+) Transcript_35503:2-592(+)